MISVTGITRNYILQPELLDKHNKTLQWLSACLLWKSELLSFQKMLDEYAPFLSALEDKKRTDHFQNLILYYKGELVDTLRKNLRDHESKLASMLETKNESRTEYFKEHDDLMDQLEAFDIVFKQFRKDFLSLVEKGTASAKQTL